MTYDTITAIKVLKLIGHFAYLVKSVFDFDPGTKFEFDCPLNCRMVKEINDVKMIQDILDISDINFNRNILSVETKKSIPFARIIFTDGFTIEELLTMNPSLQLPTCEICGGTHYHIPGSKTCYAKDFSYALKDCECK